MAISSLQSLIAQYGANFGIQTPPATPAPSTPPTDASAPAPSAKGDTVTLSPEAQAYRAAHTLPSGKFQVPNLFGDLMGALDPSSNQSDNSAPTSLADALNAPTNGNSTSANPSASITDALTNSATSASDPAKPFDSLSAFLDFLG